MKTTGMSKIYYTFKLRTREKCEMLVTTSINSASLVRARLTWTQHPRHAIITLPSFVHAFTYLISGNIQYYRRAYNKVRLAVVLFRHMHEVEKDGLFSSTLLCHKCGTTISNYYFDHKMGKKHIFVYISILSKGGRICQPVLSHSIRTCLKYIVGYIAICKKP